MSLKEVMYHWWALHPVWCNQLDWFQFEDTVDIQHIDPWSKWQTFWRQRFEMHFIVIELVWIRSVAILLTWISCNLAWISNYTHYNVWDEIIYPFSNFSDATVEVWEWISNIGSDNHLIVPLPEPKLSSRTFPKSQRAEISLTPFGIKCFAWWRHEMETFSV